MHSIHHANDYAALFRAALLDPALPTPSVVARNDDAGVASRFNVYRNNVVSALIAAMEDIFPVTTRLVGGEFFRAMARVFIASHPPRDRRLFVYGMEFPAFLNNFAPARALSYLPDIARLERARLDAWHAADLSPLDPSELAGRDPQALLDTIFLPHPAMALVTSRFAIVSILKANSAAAAEQARVDASVPETALVTRPDTEVKIHRLEGSDAAFASALAAGVALGPAAEAAFEVASDFNLGQALGMLLVAGAFTSIGQG